MGCKDKTERLKYLNSERDKQENNSGWINFHEKSIDKHKKQIEEKPNERLDQEEKLKFHVDQIENHHLKNIDYHNKEIEFLKEKISMFEKGLNICGEQIIFLNKKIQENQD